MHENPNESTPIRRFDIALSFPDEHRAVVAQVAGHLAARYGKDRVLYDHYHDAEFARLELNLYLPKLYRKESELMVLFLCREYAGKLWCRLEWRHISQLIATVDANRIMFLSFGNPGDLSDLGILGGDGYLDIATIDSAEVAAKIMQRYRINGGPWPPNPDPKPRAPIEVEISRILQHTPTTLLGREEELELLDQAWQKVQSQQTPRAHILSFIALGGEGKTSLVAKWLANLAAHDWPGCDRVFAWSFYSQGTHDQSTASADLFLREALRFFGEAEFADSAKSAFDKGKKLAQKVAEIQALLILDGLEPLQYAPSSPLAGRLKDPGLEIVLKDLAAQNRGLAIVTSRTALVDLQAFEHGAYREIELARLSREAGVQLLRSFGIQGRPKEFEDLVEKVQGHALTLNLLGAWLCDAFAGDIRQSDRVKLEEADREEGCGHAFHVLDAYVLWLETAGDAGQRALRLLTLMGLFDRPADAGCIEALLQKPAIPELTEALIDLSEAQRNKLFQNLEDARLLSVNRDGAHRLVSLDAHPLQREYFAVRLKNQQPEASRAAHQRLYEHLCATPDKPEPTLEDLQPLYQAVAHGCAAGMQQEALYKVYANRILRGARSGGFYSWKKLGAFSANLGAVACFFDTCWSRVSDLLTEDDQAWLLNETANQLRGLGRLGEALEPMRSGLKMRVKRENWKNAAQVANNLSELELTLGDVSQSIERAEESVRHAERDGDVFQRMSGRATHADALHQAGQISEAQALFVEAEKLQSEMKPEYPLLSSLQGFRYCDLLLANAERAAWQVLFDADFREQSSDCLESCHAVSARAEKTLHLWTNELTHGALLTIALDHLTLARAALYAAILEKSRPDSCVAHLDQAVQFLRRSGYQEYLLLGLLTRACLRFLQSHTTGPKVGWAEERGPASGTSKTPPQSKATGPDSAQSDLDEAWEIAARGPMRLFQADILLHRARLFGLTAQGRKLPYPWSLPDNAARTPPATCAQDLAAARRLIEKHGYGRRKQELEDAETALKKLKT